MKLLMENWRKFLKEETAEERRKRQAEKKAARDEKNKRDREERAQRPQRAAADRTRAQDKYAAADAERDREKRLESGKWTKEDKEYVLFTYEDEIEDFEETYGRKPRKTEVLQYIKPHWSTIGIGPESPLHKEIGRKSGGWALNPEMGALRLADVYQKDIKNSILPLPGKSGFEKWAERAEREAGGKPADFAKKMIQWMRSGAVMSSHPHGIEAGLADSQIGTILRLTHLTLDDIFENMEMLVKSGQSAEQAAQDISSTDEGATRINPNYNPNEGPSMDNPDFDDDEEESDENPKRIKNPKTLPVIIADPKIILRMYKYYKAAGF